LSFTLPRPGRWLAAHLLALAFGADAACPAPAASALLERFIPADCDACWSADGIPAGAPFVLDWIVPSPRGDAAPLSAAALTEAASRAGALANDATLQRRQELPPLHGLSFSVHDGPAWSGYIGLQMVVQRSGAALPAGAVGYLALVENVRAGDDGTPIERRLVRALAGPFALAGARSKFEHLVAVRLPIGAKPERLGAVGWVEVPSGQVIALARAGSSDCTVAR